MCVAGSLKISLEFLKIFLNNTEILFQSYAAKTPHKLTQESLPNDSQDASHSARPIKEPLTKYWIRGKIR